MAATRRRRTTLFVGALALDGLGAALDSGADLVCIDLEDAVPPDRKDEGRDAVLKRLASMPPPQGPQLVARVNSLGSFDGPIDVRRILMEAPAIGALLLPKVESAEEVRWAGAIAEQCNREAELYAIIETAEGLEHCAQIARAHPRLRALFFGGFDLSTALGCAMAWEPLLYARSRVVHAGALGGIEVIDSPYPDVANLDGLRAACEQVKALGMTGKAAKHASQVATIRDAFTPTAAEIERARRIIELFRQDPTRPLVYEGKLVELPAIKKLERIASL
jgi:citrate lyase beta subunit